ncbi:MAG: hypothetical protein M1387_10040 [Thaumarchaeota archaeon]|nr:hypothetical protein [Nitrososphaerota archaeon]
MRLQSEDLLKDLELIGLSKLQASVYITLHVLKEAPANTVAEITQIHRAEAYRILKELTRMGVVEPVISHPVRYRAKGPNEALKSLLDPFTQHLSQLREARSRILTKLAKMPSLNDGTDFDNGFEMLVGSQVIKRMEMMIDNASCEICSAAVISQDALLLRESFNRAVEGRGVSAMVLLNFTKRDLEAVKHLKRSGRIVMRYSDKVYSRSLIVDGKEIVFSSAPTVDSRDVFLYTRNQRFIEHYSRSFDLLFKDGIPIDEYIETLADKPA